MQKIVEGNIMGTVIQYPDKMSIQGIEELADYLDGKNIEATTYIPTEAIAPSDASKYIDQNLAW